MSTPTTVLTFAATLGCALAAGAFFAFSSFVMQGLDRAPAPAAVAAMRGINRSAVTPPFMIALFGAALLCLAVAVVSAANLDTGAGSFGLAGGLLYLLGTIAVTMRFNVPLNNALDRAEPDGAGAEDAWRRYLGPWLRWNHLRTLSSTAATAALLASLLS